MTDRFCGECANELRPEDRFCPGCGKPVHETAVAPAPDAAVPVPLLPERWAEATRRPTEQDEPPPDSSPSDRILRLRQRLSR